MLEDFVEFVEYLLQHICDALLSCGTQVNHLSSSPFSASSSLAKIVGPHTIQF